MRRFRPEAELEELYATPELRTQVEAFVREILEDAARLQEEVRAEQGSGQQLA